MVSRDQVLEVGNVGSRLHVARKDRRPNEWEPPYEPYDPCGPGEDPIIEKVADEVLKWVTPERGRIARLR